MLEPDPWLDLAPAGSSGELRVRRVDDSHRHGFWWGRDVHEHHLLVFKSETELFEFGEIPQVRSVSLDLSPHQFVIRLLESSEIELFTTLCWSLVERTRDARSDTEVLATLIAQLERWQRFLGKTRPGLLSDQEIRGLLCELEFLEAELMPQFGPDAVHYWRGPLGEPQDFAIGPTAFEVKSHTVGSQPVVIISSAAQLFNLAGDLYLMVYAVGEANASSPLAKSLAQRVAEIRAKLSSTALADFFDDLLIGVGYNDHPEYGRRFFTLSGATAYQVAEGFPRISPKSLAAGICRLKYGIELAACEPFRCDTPDWSRLGVSHGD